MGTTPEIRAGGGAFVFDIRLCRFGLAAICIKASLGVLSFIVLQILPVHSARDWPSLFVLALIGQLFAYCTHRNKWLVSLAIATTVTMFAAYYVIPSSTLLQISLAGLVAASVWQAIEMKRCAKCTIVPASKDMSAEHQP